MADLARYITFGASPRATINLIEGARALALLRGRGYVLPEDVTDLVPDVLRHRLVLSYEALADGVTADALIRTLLQQGAGAGETTGNPCSGGCAELKQRRRSRRSCSPRCGPTRSCAASNGRVIRRLDGLLQGDYRTLFRGAGLDLADLREYQHHDDVRYIDWNVTARLQTPYVREFHEDREVTAWFLLDLSASVDFGSGKRRQARGVEPSS